jgi:hypothetical protein
VKKGTVRTMGQIGAANAYLALAIGLKCLQHTGSMLLAVLELYIDACFCLIIAYHVGLRFARLR